MSVYGNETRRIERVSKSYNRGNMTGWKNWIKKKLQILIGMDFFVVVAVDFFFKQAKFN